MTRKHLLDLNVLIALADSGHEGYRKAQDWFDASDKHDMGICPLTEAGFVRITTNPAFRPGPRTSGAGHSHSSGAQGEPVVSGIARSMKVG